MLIMYIGFFVAGFGLTLHISTDVLYSHFKRMGLEERFRNTYLIGNKFSEEVGEFSLTVWEFGHLGRPIGDYMMAIGIMVFIMSVPLVVYEIIVRLF